jgi:hypothetical protein
MADSNLSAMLKQLRLNPALLKAVPALIGRYGAAGAVVLARSYLGPLAPTGEIKSGDGDGAPPHAETEAAAELSTGTRDGATTPRKVASTDAAVLSLALTKLVYELGELAAHNPGFDPKGQQPEFKLDERGRAPAMSVTHVVAVARLLKAYSAERQAAEPAPPPPTARARLQAARSERYAATPRYSYVARPTTYRTPR